MNHTKTLSPVVKKCLFIFFMCYGTNSITSGELSFQQKISVIKNLTNYAWDREEQCLAKEQEKLSSIRDEKLREVEQNLIASKRKLIAFEKKERVLEKMLTLEQYNKVCTQLTGETALIVVQDEAHKIHARIQNAQQHIAIHHEIIEHNRQTAFMKRFLVEATRILMKDQLAKIEDQSKKGSQSRRLTDTPRRNKNTSSNAQ